VDHVVLFDFPQEPSEYLRRVGRTGRAGRSGRATILVYGKQLPAAREVMKASKEGKKIKPTDNL
jgi:superfamily II DNA/RNA helicase